MIIFAGMDQSVLLINYGRQKLEFPVRAYSFGHTYRIEVLVNDAVLIFEPDEERSLRAFGHEQMDRALIAAIAVELEKIRE